MAEPQRTCVGCRRVDVPANLTRFVVRSGKVVIDPDRHGWGRGAWLHPRPACLEAAVRRGGFARSFRRPAETEALLSTGWPEGSSGV